MDINLNTYIKILFSLFVLAVNFSAMANENTPCIGVITVGSSHFWAEVKKGALQAGTELGVDIYHRAPADEGNSQGQKDIIQAAINKGCRAFVIAPSSLEINQIVSELKLANRPTVYIDRDYGGDRLSIISSNNYLAGELAGKEMVKALNGKGKVAIFRLSKDIVSTTQREQGFIKAVLNGGLELVIDEYVGVKMGHIRTNSLTILRSRQDIDGIFTPNETSTLGVLTNLQSLGIAGKAIHIGFDSHSNMINALRKGQIHGFIIQDPFSMGYLGVYHAYKAMTGLSIAAEVDSKALFISSDNINTDEVKKILNTP